MIVALVITGIRLMIVYVIVGITIQFIHAKSSDW